MTIPTDVFNQDIGYLTKVKDLIQALKNDANPFIRHGDETIFLEATNHHFGFIVYTLFDAQGIGVHTVHATFSFRDTLYDILDRGENRTRKNLPLYPTIIQVPTKVFVDATDDKCYDVRVE